MTRRRDSCHRLGLHDAKSGTITNDGTAIQLLPAGTAFAQGSIYEFTYSARIRRSMASALPRFATSPFLRNATADDAGTPIRWPATWSASTPTRFRSPTVCSTTFVHLGFNAGGEWQYSFRRHGDVDRRRRRHQSELPFSQPARTERNRQHICTRKASSRSPNTRHRSDHGPDRQTLCAVHGHQYVSGGYGNLFGERILGQGSVAIPHRPWRYRRTCPPTR